MNEQLDNSAQPTTAALPALMPALTPALDLLKNAWALYQKHFNTLVPIMLVAGIGMYLQCLFLLFEKDGTSSAATMGIFGILALIAAIIYIVGMIWGWAALLNQINKLDQPMKVGQAFTESKPYIWPLVITGILSMIFTIIGFVLLIIPGIIVGIWLTFTLYIVVVEKKKGMEALKASKNYVEGYWWPIFGRSLLMLAIIIIVSIVVGGLGHALLGEKLGTLLQNIVGLIITPWMVLYQFLLYKNVKAVKGVLAD